MLRFRKILRKKKEKEQQDVDEKSLMKIDRIRAKVLIHAQVVYAHVFVVHDLCYFIQQVIIIDFCIIITVDSICTCILNRGSWYKLYSVVPTTDLQYVLYTVCSMSLYM